MSSSLAMRAALSACLRKNLVSFTIVLARQKNPTHHEDEQGQFASYPQGENPEGAGQVYEAMGGKSPMMGDVLEADDQNAQSNQEHEHSHSNQRLKTHFGALFGSGAFDSTREAANRDGFEMVESRDWKMTVFEAILARWQI